VPGLTASGARTKITAPVRAPLVRRILFAFAVVAALAPSATAAPRLRLGFDDDRIKWMTKPDSFVALQRELGAPFTRITIPWRRGEVRPRPVVQTYLHRAAAAGRLQQKVVLAVYGSAADAPTDALSRQQFCRYARSLMARVPAMSAIVIWNEANSPRYWPASAGARAYEALLAKCWDMLHAARPNVNVVDSTASHYDPAGFIRALGAAYRASGRAKPIVDTFGHNPYPDFAAEEPWAVHPAGATIGEGDYDKLMAAITDAFAFTAQRVPSDSWRRLWYLEDGFQTFVPRFFEWVYNGLYTGRENDRTVLPAFGFRRSQSSQLTAAISLAYCQPAVSAFFNFELIDETRLVGWQSGLLYANGIRKPSFSAYKQIAAAASSGSIDCSKVAGAPLPSHDASP
jgi:hypothetical protein